jgi:acyl dehydratase
MPRLLQVSPMAVEPNCPSECPSAHDVVLLAALASLRFARPVRHGSTAKQWTSRPHRGQMSGKGLSCSSGQRGGTMAVRGSAVEASRARRALICSRSMAVRFCGARSTDVREGKADHSRDAS